MATVTYIREKTQNKTAMGRVMTYVSKDEKTLLDDIKLVSGVNCCGETAFEEFMATKQQYGKANGTFFYQYVQSFHPDEDVTPQTINEIGCKLAEYFKGHEVLVATHIDADHKHNHLIINSVNVNTGKKLQLKPGSIHDIRNLSDEICREYGLSIVEPAEQKIQGVNTREYRSAVKGESWKFALMNAIDTATTSSRTKAEFIANMQKMGYQVNWQNSHKYITYTIPSGMKCRDKKLHDDKYLKANMEEYYAKLKQVEGTQQTGKSVGRIQHEIKPVCDTAAAFGRFAENADRDYNCTDSNARADKEASDMGEYSRQSQSGTFGYGQQQCGSNRRNEEFAEHGDENADGETEEYYSNDDFGGDETSDEYAQSQRFDTNQGKSQVGGDWCDTAVDILYLAKTIEDMVNPYDPDKNKKKRTVRKSKKHNKKHNHGHDYEPEM